MEPKDHPDYPITVYPDGRIWLKPRTIQRTNNRPCPCGGRWATCFLPRRSPYLKVTVPAGRCPKASRFVHQVVAEAFYGPRPPGHHTLHLDDNPLNNSAANLRWGTAKENMATRRPSCGEQHYASRLSADIIHEIRLRHRLGETNAQMGLDYGVSTNAIRMIVIGRTWKSVP